MKRLDENNRTEKYWTATVLASMIMESQFGGLKTFLSLLKDDSGKLPFKDRNNRKLHIDLKEFMEADFNYENVQLSTELWYGRDFTENNEYAVPDITLVLMDKYLIVGEAKFFQRIQKNAIEHQIYLQKKTINDILQNTEIQYVHHCFIYGGSEKFTQIEGVDSIITWSDLLSEFETEFGSSHYLVRVLSKGVSNYKEEFPPKGERESYYVDQLDFFDLVAKATTEQEKIFIGLGLEGDAARTIENLCEVIVEELQILQKTDQERFTKRPAFLKDKKYKRQSALEYLLVHSNQKYKVDYVDIEKGSGNDKSRNQNWVDGYTFIQSLKRILKK